LDPGLVRLAQTGDVDAFTALITGRIGRMTRTAMAIVGHEADARDAVAETLAAVWRELPRLRDVDAFDAWSQRILVHACRRVLRTRGRARVREVAIEVASSVPVAMGSESPDGVVRRQALERAFDRLEADDRALLVLHHLDGRPLAEIAGALDIPVGTAKSRLHHARQALERALAREDR
jgi:RNA polymerase sigma-70 factor (ECF subfamily)